MQDADEFAVRSVNHRHLVRRTPHPYEAYEPEELLRETIASRRAGLAEFYDELDAASWLRAHGVEPERARGWLVG